MNNNLVSVVYSTREYNVDFFNHLRKMFSNPKTDILVYVNKGDHSLPEIYNKGLEETKNDIVVFLHDDIIIETKNMNDKIVKLFEKNPEYGIIGIAGTTDLVSGQWWEIKKSMVGKVYHEQEGKRWLSKYSNESYVDKLKDVVCIDGLFMMVHKQRIKHTFDESFPGFHFYDIPFCISNYINKVKIGVTTKFDIVHKSVGQTNEQWEQNKVIFEEKFKNDLPLKLTDNKTFKDKLNYSHSSIGVGMVTYNAPDRIKQSAATVPEWIEHFVIVNDGTPYDESVYPANAHIINHETNKSVGQAKSTAMKYLLDQGCEHIFIMEDDVLIKNAKVFDQYIQTSILSGVKHLNYALQGPANKKGAKGFTNLEERALQGELTEPNPRQIVTYPDKVEIALYPNCVGSFSYYNREVLEKIGFFDAFYKNAWEHVDHTMEAFKKGYTTPYWWFADINKSWEYITDIEGCIENSTIARSDQWKKNYELGLQHFKNKHKFGPTEVPDFPPEKVTQMLNTLYQMR